MDGLAITDFFQYGNTGLLVFVLLKLTKVSTKICDLSKRCPAMDSEKPCPKGGDNYGKAKET